MHNIRTAILAACLGTIASLAAHAQYDSFGEGPGSLASNTAGSYDAAFGVDSMYSNNEGEGTPPSVRYPSTQTPMAAITRPPVPGRSMETTAVITRAAVR